MQYRKLAKTAMVMVIILSLAGCANTMEGVGRDVENAGEKIQETF